MPRRSHRTPSYRLHKPTGQAVVTIAGRDFYLGRHDTPESRAEYDRLIAEWLAGGRVVAPRPAVRAPAPTDDPADLTVTELVVAYYRHAEGYYRKNGRPTREVVNIKTALRPLRRLYGHTPARDFGPKALKVIRRDLIESGLCRGVVNQRVKHVVRCFGWGVEEELVPPSVHHGLRAVKSLRKGRSPARETEPVRPVPDVAVDAIRPHVSRQVWGMVELMRLTGMRPGEVVMMRSCDLDTTGRVWVYRPAEHKTEHHDRDRTIYLGPRAQAIVREWLRTDLSAYLFIPSEADAERKAGMRAARKSPVQPSQRDRRTARPRKTPGDRYTVDSFRRAIEYGCALANPHPTLAGIGRTKRTPEQRAELRTWIKTHRWHPNQLRHNAATYLRREFGLDVARVILGHSSPAVTETYAEVDREKAIEVMGRVG